MFDIDYQSFLKQHNLVYELPPRNKLDGFPLGNGHLGGMVYAPYLGEVEFDIVILAEMVDKIPILQSNTYFYDIFGYELF
jgi:hypothetical protein